MLKESLQVTPLQVLFEYYAAKSHLVSSFSSATSHCIFVTNRAASGIICPSRYRAYPINFAGTKILGNALTHLPCRCQPPPSRFERVGISSSACYLPLVQFPPLARESLCC
jgi:hypothetical protein